MELFRFAHPEYFWALLLIPVLTILFVYFRIQRRKALRKFGEPELVNLLMPNVSGVRPVVRFILLMMALSLFIAGTARPQFGSKLKKVKRQGVEIVIALDVSNSMMAEDIKPNRLERAKRAIDRLISKLKDDKIGLIVFAGDAYTQLPITSDYNSAQLFLSSVNPEMIPKQGTAVGAAIGMAKRSFTASTEASKAIIVITDGENHEDDAVAAAEEAHKDGIVVHTIGMGLPQGAPIPVRAGGQGEYRKDKEGNVVITRLDEVTLQKIAAAGGGIYLRANTAQVGLDDLFDEINKMQKTEMEARTFSEYEEQFQYFFAAGLLLLLLEFFMLERKNKYLKRIKLFK
ncbi:MAG TPA: VWA domain-containing protein [Prolixibacteraceae bacterium]|nr:VWA domain-containing protein [Prolixibacteraceae bacterium]